MGVPVKGYPDYLVFEDGRIFSKKSNKFLVPSSNQRYQSVELHDNGKHERLLVHRIVATAFIPNPENYPQVNHKDENPLNNHVDNLEWCTAKYNMNYGEGAKTRHKKIDYSKPIFRKRAIENSMNLRKPILQFTKDGELVARYSSTADAMRTLGLKNAHITECARGKRQTAHGFVWKYERGNDLSAYQY
jgi:hypothetical protein